MKELAGAALGVSREEFRISAAQVAEWFGIC
jgi:hypothetical protein